MDKLMELCAQWNVDMDTLLRGDVRAATQGDAAQYGAHMDRQGKLMAGATGLILLGVAAMMAVFALGNASDACGLLGVILLLGCVVVAVTIYIVADGQHEHFVQKNPQLPQFYTEKQLDDFAQRKPWLTAIPVALILLDVIGLIAAIGLLGESGDVAVFAIMAVFLLVMGVAVAALVYASYQEDKYDIAKYNRENDPSPLAQARRKNHRMWGGVIMLTATAIFLVWGIMGGKPAWHYSWVTFPAGGILCAVKDNLMTMWETRADLAAKK